MKLPLQIIAFVALTLMCAQKLMATTLTFALLEKNICIMHCDSDSVKVDVNSTVISFDNRLYQQGIHIGTFDKKTAIKKGQLSVVIYIYNLQGKAVAEGIASGVNASFAITIFDGNQHLSEDFSFEHEAEEFALKLRQLGKL